MGESALLQSGLQVIPGRPAGEGRPERKQPEQFVNGWPSGETGVSVVRRRGRVGQALG